MNWLLEVVRWFSLGLAIFSIFLAAYSMWISIRHNKRLAAENRKLHLLNLDLRAKCDLYWEEIVELRERLYDGEEN
jgi:cbb3-type cytochrome oxidase subunit 3